ncbi:MAG: type 4a pilus biogenesis protein PilO [Deltaproteobacteria bacterium]|nr:type 4a pilus biogenesis protein PilO [Deltaproteobacteria bacterium]
MVWYYLDVLLERPLSQQLLFIGALVLLLAALDYALVYRHQAGRIARVAADIELVRLEEARLRAQLGRLPRLRKEAATLGRAVLSRLPRSTGASTPLETVSARAAMAGLAVIRFQPGAVRAGEHLTEVPMEVEVKGTFHDLLSLFDLMAGSPDLLNVTDLAIDALPEEDGRTMLRIALEMAAARLPTEGTDTDAEMSAGAGPDSPAPSRSPAPIPARAGDEPPLRDPFQPYKPPPPPEAAPQPHPEPVQDQPVEPDPAQRLHAAGIVWEKSAAVALVKDAEGFGHVVQPGAHLADRRYRVKAITPCEVVLETTRNGPNSRQTRLRVPRCAGFESEDENPPRKRDLP